MREEARVIKKIKGKVRPITIDSLGISSSRESCQMVSSKQENSWVIDCTLIIQGQQGVIHPGWRKQRAKKLNSTSKGEIVVYVVVNSRSLN